MGVGTRVSVHRNLNNVMKPGADLIYSLMPWLNSIMTTPPPPPHNHPPTHILYLWEIRENWDYKMTSIYSSCSEAFNLGTKGGFVRYPAFWVGGDVSALLAVLNSARSYFKGCKSAKAPRNDSTANLWCVVNSDFIFWPFVFQFIPNLL